MTLSALPTLQVVIAFNPTYSGTTLLTATTQALPTVGSSNSYWTDVTPYVQDFTTNSGKQHYLDRVEAATMKMTVNNRSGFFTNGATNGTGYIVTPRMPIAITATYSGVTYPVYWGIIDTITERNPDQLNAELEIDASDLTKLLSLRYLHNPALWATYAKSTSAAHWYRMDNTTAVTVTSASGNGTSITFQAVNNYASGQNVTVSGLAGPTGLNVTNLTITSATSSSFTVSSSVTGTSSGSGVAYVTAIPDYIGSAAGTFGGQVSYPTNGAIIYDSNGCVDLAAGSSQPVGSLTFPIGTGTFGGFDLWVLGQQTAGTTIATVEDTSATYNISLAINGIGQAIVNVTPIAGGSTSTYTSTKIINDGYWHHVGIVGNTSGTLYLYADGTFTSMGSYTGFKNLLGLSNFVVGGASFPGYVDELIISNTSSYSTLGQEVQNRYIAGSLLQGGFPVTSSKVLSGDRIAEILVIAGFGSVNAGTVSGGLAPKSTISILSNTYYISNSYQTPTLYSQGSSGNGFCAVEPYYWDSPVYGSTALDLILQVCDTDIGIFFQDAGGNLRFYTQNYFGSWSFTSATPPSTPTYSWTPSYTTPTGASIWADDFVTSNYAYDGPSLQLVRDEADVWTKVRITPQAGVDQIFENTSNEARWGYSTLNKSSTVSATLSDALSAAYFLGYIFRTPLPRVQSVSLHSETQNGNNLYAQLGRTIYDVVQFVRNSAPGAGTNSNPIQSGKVNEMMAIESIAHDFRADPGQWITTYTLDPYPVRS